MQHYTKQLLSQIKKPYSKIEALVSLQLALENQKPMKTTLLHLANQWHWEKHKTQRFLHKLKEENILHYLPSSRGITLSLCNPTDANKTCAPQKQYKAPTPNTSQYDVRGITEAFQQLFLYNAKQLSLPTKTIENANPKQWQSAIEKLLTTDGYTLEQLRTVYNYLKRDEFWRKQVFNTNSLRYKFQSLLANATTKKQPSKQQQLTEEQLRALIKERYDYEL